MLKVRIIVMVVSLSIVFSLLTATCFAADNPQYYLQKIVETPSGFCAVIGSFLEGESHRVIRYDSEYRVKDVLFLSDIYADLKVLDIASYENMLLATTKRDSDYYILIVHDATIRMKRTDTLPYIADGRFFWINGTKVHILDVDLSEKMVDLPTEAYEVGLSRGTVAYVGLDQNLYVEKNGRFIKKLNLALLESDQPTNEWPITVATVYDDCYIGYASISGKHFIRISDMKDFNLENIGTIVGSKLLHGGEVLFQMLSDFSGGKPIEYHQLVITDADVIASKAGTILDPYGENEIVGWMFKDKQNNEVTTYEHFYSDHLRVNGKVVGLVLPFRDVAENRWSYSDIAFVYYNNILRGTWDSTFSPEGKVDVATFATILYRLNCKYNQLSEAEEGEWYVLPMKWAVDSRMIPAEYVPYHKLTRIELSKMIYQFFYSNRNLLLDSSLSKELKDQLETLNSVTAEQALEWNIAAGIFKGRDDGMNETSLVTREEIAALIRRSMKFFPIDWYIERYH